MEGGDKSIGRAYLVKKLRGCGLSRRRAVRILNFVFAEMKKALRRGQEVEFALGKLARIWRWPVEPPRVKSSARRQSYKVEWRLDEAEDQLLNPEKWTGVPELRCPRRRARKTGK